MRKRRFEEMEERKEHANMMERIYTMIANMPTYQPVEKILKEIGASIDVQDIVADYVEGRIERILNLDDDGRSVRRLREKIKEIWRDEGE